MARKRKIAFYSSSAAHVASFVANVGDQAEVLVLNQAEHAAWGRQVRDADVVVIGDGDSLTEGGMVLGMAIAHERFVITETRIPDLPNVITVDVQGELAQKALDTARGLSLVGGRALAASEGFAILDPSGGIQRAAKLVRYKERPLPWALVVCSLFVSTNKDGLVEPDAAMKGYKAAPILCFLGTDSESLLAAYGEHMRAAAAESDRQNTPPARA